MLLSAQRVRRAGQAGLAGINTFLFRHGDITVPDMNWEHPLLGLIVQQYQGTLVAQTADVPPGGNLVLSYLDIAFHDAVTPERVQTALGQYQSNLTSQGVGHSVEYDGVAIRLGTQDSLRPEALQEFVTLRDRALALLRDPNSHVPADVPRLAILLSRDGDHLAFQLDPTTEKFLRHRRPTPWPKPVLNVTIAHDVAAQLSSTLADTFFHVAPLVTGLSLDELIAFGGIEVRNGQTNDVLWSWPAGAQVSSYCLSCHQPDTLVPVQAEFRCSYCGHPQDNNGLWVTTLS